MLKNSESSELVNQGEAKDFLRTALTWRGSVSPQIMPRVLVTTAYAAIIVALSGHFPALGLSVTPFEYSGVVLGLLLVQRVNAGQERWWEARKLWGSIVNQSRNLAIISTSYASAERSLRHQLLSWVAVWPHVMRESLRDERSLPEADRLLGTQEADQLRAAAHMPMYVGNRLAQLLRELRGQGLDDFAFTRAERERALLIDAIGACERIRSTPIPFVLAIKTRRFIFLFLLLLPFAVVDRAEGWMTPLIVALASYPLFSLDEIGAELQNPFSPRNLSHLPLLGICEKIESNVMGLDLRG